MYSIYSLASLANAKYPLAFGLCFSLKYSHVFSSSNCYISEHKYIHAHICKNDSYDIWFSAQKGLEFAST